MACGVHRDQHLVSLITGPTESTDKQKVRVKQVALLGLRGDVTAWGGSRPAGATGLIGGQGAGWSYGGGASVCQHQEGFGGY